MFPLFTITTLTAPVEKKKERRNEYKSFAKENLCNKNDKSMKDEKTR
jgi:hypothetical protein